MGFASGSNLIAVETPAWNVIPASGVATIAQLGFEPDLPQVSADAQIEMHASEASDITSPELSESAVQAFIRRNNLPSDDLRRALQIVRESFDLAEPLTLTVEEDADTNERWLEIAAVARGTAEDIIAGRRNYMRTLRRTAAPAIQEHVRLFLAGVER